MTKTNTPEIDTLPWTNPTQKAIKDLNLVAEWVGTGHSESELTIYNSIADSVRFRGSPGLFFGRLCKLLFIAGIILIPSTAYYSRNYSRTIGSSLVQ